MPFESIVCPVDGAVTEFIKVEQDTYYCPHHRGIIKWTNSVRVGPVGFFCPCGNMVEAQCELCEGGCCHECDIGAMRQRLLSLDKNMAAGRSERETFGHVLIPVYGFGYLEHIDHYKVRAVTGRGVRIRWLTKIDAKYGEEQSTVIGPFLTPGDIWPQLAEDPSQLCHVCIECVWAKIPATVEAITAGRICEHPGCGAAPSDRCRCCGNRFCTRHFPDNARRLPPRLTGGYRTKKSYQAPDQDGMCAMCRDERPLVAKEAMPEHPFARDHQINRLLRELDADSPPCVRDLVFDEEVAAFRGLTSLYGRRARARDSYNRQDFLISTYKVVNGLDDEQTAGPVPKLNVVAGRRNGRRAQLLACT